MPPNILLVTAPGAGSGLGRVLDDAGHRVYPSHSVAAACLVLEDGGIDLALLDLNSADVDGADAVRAIRLRTPAPIVFTESGQPARIDRMLAAGADDFLSKPFSPAQLRARVCVALDDRRGRETAMVIGDLWVDPLRRTVWLDGARLDLSRREFDLLSCLAARAGEVVPRGDLAKAVWPESSVDVNRSIDVQLSSLRRKLGETVGRPRYLHTVRGVGFRLWPDVGARRSSAAPGR
jgi:DNA-binding response OmpR family regulator